MFPRISIFDSLITEAELLYLKTTIEFDAPIDFKSEISDFDSVVQNGF